MRYLTCILLVAGLVFAGCNQEDEVTTPTGGGGGGNGGGGSTLTASSIYQFSITHPISGQVRTAIGTSNDVTSSNNSSSDLGADGITTYYDLGGAVDRFLGEDELGNWLVERVNIRFGHKPYNPNAGASTNEWLETYLTEGSMNYATEAYSHWNDPTMKVTVSYEDGQDNFFSSETGENANSTFNVVDIDYIPASGWLPAYLKFYATFNCDTDAGPMQGHLIATLTVL